MNSLTDDAALRALLDDLHARSLAQDTSIDEYYAAGAERPTGYEAEDSAGRVFWRDKFVALDRDKAELCYALCRAANATRIVEAGTSFGVSTLYLAAAVRDNGSGTVTTCDIEPTKAAVARRHLEQTGLMDQVDMRIGDIRETLRDLDGPVDVLLLDIWATVAADVIALVGPHLRLGGIVLADNSEMRRALYAGLFAYLHDPAHGFTTMTLPFSGGLELAVRTAPPRV